MRRVSLVFCVVAVVLLGMTTTMATTTAAQEASPAASPAALPPLLAEWATAVNSGDVDQVLALYTDDALWEEVAIGLAAQRPGRDRGAPRPALHGRAGHYAST